MRHLWLLLLVAPAFADVTGPATGTIPTNVNSPSDGQCLVYSGTSLVWQNAPCGSGSGITALTGDVAASGPGSAAATIQPAAVTAAKFQNLDASSIFCNTGGAPATGAFCTAAQIKTLLAYQASDIAGLGTFAFSNMSATTLNGNTFTPGTYTVTGAAGKTFTFNANLTITGTDGTTWTGPATNATLAALNIAQSYTQSQTFAGAPAIFVAAGSPQAVWDATGAGTDLKNWDITISGTTFLVRAINDARSSASNVLSCARGSTFHVASCGIGNTTDLFPVTVDGPIYSTSGAAASVTGCGTAGTIRGNGTAGTFVVGTGAATCTFVVTPGLTAATGWIVDMDDVTAVIHCPNNGTIASTTTGTAKCNSTVTTGDLITFTLRPF